MRVLLVTNDFPPTIGGIQSYLRDFISTLPPQDVVVFASTQDAAAAADWDDQAAYRVYRWPRRVMLPTPATACRMQQIIRAENIDVVWFGAAAPLALMARAACAAGARRIIASTHGHEVGWSMLPGARQVLRVIGSHCDVVTYISDYTLSRFRAAFGEPTFEWLPSGVDSHRFSPLSAVQRQAVRSQLGWRTGGHYVVCDSGRMCSPTFPTPPSSLLVVAPAASPPGFGDSPETSPTTASFSPAGWERSACPTCCMPPMCLPCPAAPAAAASMLRGWASCTSKPRPLAFP